MQTSPLIRNLRLAGLVVGFIAFSLTTVHWFQASLNVETVQHGPGAISVANK